MKRIMLAVPAVLALILASCATDGMNAQRQEPTMSAGDKPDVACTLSPAELRERRDALLPGLLKRAEKREPLENGYRLRFQHRPGLLEELVRIVEQERGCCSFLKFQLTVEPSEGPILFDVTGPPGTREALDKL